MSTFSASVSAGEQGPAITLAGELDLSALAEFRELVAGQLSGGIRCLTIDVSGLSFSDSASIRVLMLAAVTLRERGGGLVLRHPQPALVRVLQIMDAGELITIRGRDEAESQGQSPA